jgi:hypothetical protein
MQRQPCRRATVDTVTAVALGDDSAFCSAVQPRRRPLPGEDLQPAHRLGLDLGKSSVSDTCLTRSTQGRTLAPSAPAHERCEIKAAYGLSSRSRRFVACVRAPRLRSARHHYGDVEEMAPQVCPAVCERDRFAGSVSGDGLVAPSPPCAQHAYLGR